MESSERQTREGEAPAEPRRAPPVAAPRTIPPAAGLLKLVRQATELVVASAALHRNVKLYLGEDS